MPRVLYSRARLLAACGQAHTDLETLLVDSNKLRSLRGVSAATNLTTFTASSNQLLDTAGAGALLHLSFLDLSANSLKQCTEVGDMVRLRTLILAGNSLAALPNLSRLSALGTIDLSSNHLASLDELAAAIAHGASSRLRVSPIRELRLSGNTALDASDDLRLEVLHHLPKLAVLDGTPITAEERVASHNLYGGDSEQLAAIRRGHFSDALNTAEQIELPHLLQLYRHQYTAAYQKRQLVPPKWG